MERLTRHFDESKNEDLELYDVRDIGLELLKTKRLSKLEDILEKYEIDELYTLDKILEIHRWLSNHDVMFNELKKYKDIEEKLGIDLATLFKALLEDGIFFNDGYGKIIHVKAKDLWLRTDVKNYIIDFYKPFYTSNLFVDCKLKDYGKKGEGGWALTKEELL